MRSALLVFVGSTSLVLAGCGGEAGNGVREEEAPPEEVGVAVSELTNCVRTELAYAVVSVQDCVFRLMENNFVCAEGVVGQASTEILSGKGKTATVVGTKLFDQLYTGVSVWATPASIATQWGHTVASNHGTICTDPNPGVIGNLAAWNLDPFTKTAVPE